MTTKDEIVRFLSDFKQKLEFWGLQIRLDRKKNIDTLAELELTALKLKGILKELKINDYSQGPEEDILYKSQDMWIFGKNIKGREVYIKITLGQLSDKVICISFHFLSTRCNTHLINDTNYSHEKSNHRKRNVAPHREKKLDISKRFIRH